MKQTEHQKNLNQTKPMDRIVVEEDKSIPFKRSMIEGIKVFGERNSGNNYIMHLLDKNLALKYTTRERWINKDMGWTHGLPGEYAEETLEKILFLFIFKNPYSWLLSFKEKTHTNQSFRGMNMMKFLQTPVEGYFNPVDMLMSKYRGYLDFKASHKFMTLYEITLKRPVMFLEAITSDNNLSQSSDYFTPIENTTHPSSRLLDKLFDKKAYYLEEQWKEKLSDREISFINKFLDKDVMKKLMYEIL